MADIVFSKNNKSFLTENILIFTVKSIANILGVEHYECRIDTNKITLSINEVTINFPLSSEGKIQKVLTEVIEVKYVNSPIGDYQIPILDFSSDKEIFGVGKNNVCVNFDFVGITLIMLTRLEEILVQKKDQFGRFSYNDSLAKKYNFVQIPIVDEYCFLLKKILQEKFNLKFVERESKIIPSHDIDFISIADNIPYFFKTNILKFKKDKNVVSFIKVNFQLLKSLLFQKKDVCFHAIEQLIDDSKKFSLRSEFYFMQTQKSMHDSGYDSRTPKLKVTYKKILESNMLIGFHAGFSTFLDEKLYQAQKIILENAVGKPITINRQHYLKIKLPETFEIFKNSGIKADSTLGFAEMEGFRCGTCVPYYYFDLQSDNETNIKISPLIAMDVTLIDYRKMDDAASLQTMQDLYKKIKKIGGEFTILIHNSTLVTHKDWYQNVYLMFLKKLNYDYKRD